METKIWNIYMMNLELIVGVICIIVLTFLLVHYKYDNDAKVRAQYILNGENSSCPVERFTVADAQDFHNYAEIKRVAENVPNNFIEERLNDPLVQDRVNPDTNGISMPIINMTGPATQVKINQDRLSYLTQSDYSTNPPFPIVSCANSSINSRFKTGPLKALPNQVMCGFPNRVNGENFYRTYFQTEPAPLEDVDTRGANYFYYSNFMHPMKISQRILSRNTKGLAPEINKYKNIPTGYNYAFHDSPSTRV